MSKLLSTIHHVSVCVADLEQSIAWYRTSFACEVLQSEKTFAVLQFENIRLHLLLPSVQRPHLAFQKDDAAEFGELREQRDGVRSTFVADPTGNPIELVLEELPAETT